MDRYTPMGTPTDSPEETPSEGLPDKPEPDVPLPDSEAAVDTEQQPHADYLKSIMPPRRPPRSKWPVFVLLGVIVLAGLAGGGWYWLSRHHTAKPAPAKTTTSRTTPPPAVTNSDAAGTSAHYISNGHDLNLEFDYPVDWTVTPPSSNNTNDQTITLTSPIINFSTNDQTVAGKVVVLVRPGTAQLTELNGGASAAQASTQIAYSKPTSSQHQYPYLTFLHLGSGSGAAFQEVVVTGTLQFTQGQGVTPSSLSVDPIISASFYHCTTQACTGSGAAPLGITPTDWQNNALFQQTLAIFESMQLH